jgi:hypothetical protein
MGDVMKKSASCLKVFMLFCIFWIISTAAAHAVAMYGGRIVHINPVERKIVLKLGSGAEKTVLLEEECKAYKQSQPARLHQFRVGEYVVLKLSSPLNEDPLRAEIIMDEVSAKRFQAQRTIVPLVRIVTGGFATTGGTAAPGMAPLTGNYVNAVTPPPGVQHITGSPYHSGSTFPSGNAPTSAAASPWGSPAFGSVISPPPDPATNPSCSPNPPPAQGQGSTNPQGSPTTSPGQDWLLNTAQNPSISLYTINNF